MLWFLSGLGVTRSVFSPLILLGMVVASTCEHLRSTPACQSSKTKKREFFFFFKPPPLSRRTETNFSDLPSWCQSLVCVEVWGAWGSCALTPLIHWGSWGLTPLPHSSPNTKRVLYCFVRHECVAVWSSEMWEAVCSEACVSFEGLDRLGRVVELQTFMFTRGLCHLTGDGKNKTMKQMDKNCKLCLVFCL